MKIRKFATGALAAGVAVVALAACSTGPSGGESGQATASGSVITQAPVEGATEMELWTFVELHGKFYTTMAEKWNEANPDKKVQINVNVLPYDDMHLSLIHI